MKNLTYIAVPYSADPELGVELSVTYSKKVREMGFVPLSPILAFSSLFDNDSEYEQALECCCDALSHCGQVMFVVVNGKLSRGQRIEYDHALELGIPIIIEDYGKVKTLFPWHILSGIATI